ncbi:hypothetical protein TWF694_003329 [Orbilia ellipsospora]|uniref:Ubiquitin 3 binding protein But2 C-terminal domain-containing protein n=1 Tax=Orbilia ellipsospora TaxID=2528407 RepID=A0AAV9X1A3_9PEZI
MFKPIIFSLLCLSGSMAAPTTVRTEDVVADFSDVPVPSGAPVGFVPIDVYKGLKFIGFLAGNPVSNPEPVDIKTDAPYATYRFLTNSPIETDQGYLRTKYPGSSVKSFDLHSMDFHCATTNYTPTTVTSAIECNILFQPLRGNERLTAQTVSFKPVTGMNSEQHVKFGDEFKGITEVIITYLDTPDARDTPSKVIVMGMDNLDYTLTF